VQYHGRQGREAEAGKLGRLGIDAIDGCIEGWIIGQSREYGTRDAAQRMTDEVHRYTRQVALGCRIAVDIEGLDGGGYIEQINNTLAQVIPAVHHVQRVDEQAAGADVRQVCRYRLQGIVGGITKVAFASVIGTDQRVQLGNERGQSRVVQSFIGIDGCLDCGLECGLVKRAEARDSAGCCACQTMEGLIDGDNSLTGSLGQQNSWQHGDTAIHSNTVLEDGHAVRLGGVRTGCGTIGC